MLIHLLAGNKPSVGSIRSLRMEVYWLSLSATLERRPPTSREGRLILSNRSNQSQQSFITWIAVHHLVQFGSRCLQTMTLRAINHFRQIKSKTLINWATWLGNKQSARSNLYRWGLSALSTFLCRRCTLISWLRRTSTKETIFHIKPGWDRFQAINQKFKILKLFQSRPMMIRGLILDLTR